MIRASEIFWSVIFTTNLVVMINCIMQDKQMGIFFSGFGLSMSLYMLTRESKKDSAV